MATDDSTTLWPIFAGGAAVIIAACGKLIHYVLKARANGASPSPNFEQVKSMIDRRIEPIRKDLDRAEKLLESAALTANENAKSIAVLIQKTSSIEDKLDETHKDVRQLLKGLR